MKIFDLIKVELNRMLHAPMTWFFFALISMCPLLGYKVVFPIAPDTTAAIYLANPFIVGGIGASFLFAFFSIMNFNRTVKNQMESILYSVVSPMKIHIVQLLSLFVTGVVWTAIVGILYLPYTMKMLKEVFWAKEYISVFFIYWGMAMTLALLLAATFYNVWKRADAAIISMSLILLVGLTKIAQSTKLSFELYFPDLGFSSDFGNTTLYRVALYSRGLWLCVFAGAWMLSIFEIRVYGKNWFGSVVHNLKKSYLIVPSILLIGLGIILYIKQPYIYFDQGVNVSTDDGAETWTQFEYGEEEEYHYELLHTDIDLSVDCKKGRMRGTATYYLENRDEVEQECRVSLDPGFEIEKMIVNGEEMTFGEISRKDDLPGKNIVCMMPSDKKIELEIQYIYNPKITSTAVLYMDSEITPEYISLGTVTPFINETITDDSDYICKAKMPKNLQVIVGGLVSSNVEETQNDYAIWKIEGCGVQPQIFAGDYVEIDVATVDFPVHFYYGKNHQREFEEIDVEQILQDTIQYCTNHYGSLPYTKDYPLNIVVSNAHMMGGAAVDNLSYMGENNFSAENLQDQQKGANAREVIAHEIIHQWWGIHVPIMDEEDEFWSAEAFTCYITYRLMKELYGEEYANKNYVAGWEKEYQDLMNNFYIQNPEYQVSLSKYNQERLDSMITDTNLYAIGPLELKRAADIIGEEKLDEVLKYLFEECQDMNLFYISKQDFLDACKLSEDQISLAVTYKDRGK